MLILSRKRDEAIVVGDGKDKVTIVVVDIRGDKVRIGIQADQNTPVHRQEVYDTIKRANGDLTKKPER